MRERPILFKGEMVRAILDGRKTMTRRVVKTDHDIIGERDDGTLWPWREDAEHGGDIWYLCPYGQPGDRLWVRENGWERPGRTPRMMRDGADTWAPYYYDADGLSEQDSADFKQWGFRRRPSIHMPRWASRITLEITGVRVERLQDITYGDAAKEGLVFSESLGGCPSWAAESGGQWYDNPGSAFRELWEGINRSDSWSLNPFVWVIEFKRIE